MMIMLSIITGLLLVLIPALYMYCDLISELVELKEYLALSMVSSFVIGLIILLICGYFIK